MDFRLKKNIAERNPQLAQAIENGQPAIGKTICGKMACSIINNENSVEDTESFTHVIMTNSGGDTPSDKFELQSNLSKILQEMKLKKRTVSTCVVDENINEDRVRKLAEYTCRKEDYKIQIQTSQPRSQNNTSKNKITGNIRINKDNQETIIIKPVHGTSYADVIRSMKKEVDTNGVVIEKIDKTKRGDIQVKIKSNEENLRKDFRERLKNKMENKANVGRKIRSQTIMIMNVDETTNIDEIKAIVHGEIGEQAQDEMQLRLSSVSNERGLKHAFLTLEENKARLLLQKRKIGDGWNRWRVRQLETLPKCYRCHRVGHIAIKCNKKGNEELCHKCGEQGHLRSNCKNAERCYLCDENGHKAETIKCPEYRRLLKEQRKEKRETLQRT